MGVGLGGIVLLLRLTQDCDMSVDEARIVHLSVVNHLLQGVDHLLEGVNHSLECVNHLLEGVNNLLARVNHLLEGVNSYVLIPSPLFRPIFCKGVNNRQYKH